MSMEKQNWQEEQLRVDEVVAEIDKRIEHFQEHVGVIKADIVEIRKNFWDDVTVNFDDAVEAAETYASMKQQAEVLSERERSHRHAQKQLIALTRLRQSPYFGRIDFREETERKAESIYLGIASFLDEQEENFLVYDWRAPVSSLYYDYSPGPAEYDTPGGIISGTMDLKRQFIIRDSRIRSMFDTGVTIGDELLQEVLGKHADTQMKSIVATIQKEQNRIIRNERSRLLVVQGAAGSGKTSAALQRVAYLLYRYRTTLQAENILLFSPNPMFNSYISTVLPELGEENMQQTTFMEYLEHRIGDTFTLEDPFAQMEYILTAMDEPGYSARITGIQYKASNDFMQLIDNYISVLSKEGMPFKDMQFRNRKLISAERIKQEFYNLDTGLPIPNRMRLLCHWLLKELKEKARQERTKPWVEEAVELLDNETYVQVYQQLKSKKGFTEETFDDFEREQKLLATIVVQEHFKPLREEVMQLSFVDVPAIYRQLFANAQQLNLSDQLPQNWSDICTATIEQLDRSVLTYEDATPYLYLQERIEGFQTNNSVRHVFIDEAQDYSPFQFTFIKHLFPRSKLTVLGDLNQAIYAHATDKNPFAPLYAIYGTEQAETIVLTRSYRSTRPIVDFTRGMIEGGDAIEPFNRDGVKPTLTHAVDGADLAERVLTCIESLHAAGHGTIAVICKTAQESQEAYEALQGKLPIHLVGKETISFKSGTVVIPSYLAKGVEFDAVIIYNASSTQYGRESERKLFYTACTRAMHELHVYYLDELSPFISTLAPQTYIRQ